MQGALLDDPQFLREIVEGVLQHLLEAEITEHLERPPTSAPISAKGTATATKRKLRSRVGTLELPETQDREGTFSTSGTCPLPGHEKALHLRNGI